MNGFNDLVSKKLPNPTPSQRRVIEYIIDQYDEVIFLPASRVALNAGVSEATLVRVSQYLGFSGYPEMQRMLRKGLQERLSTISRLEKTIEHVESESDILTMVIQEDINNLKETLRDISVEDFSLVVNKIVYAQRIYVIGLLQAHAPALVLTSALRNLREDVYLLDGHLDDWDVIAGVNSEDLVIGISIPRYTRLTIEIVEYAHKNKANTVAITDSALSPLVSYVECLLPVKRRLNSYIESFTAAISLVNAIVTAVSLKNPQETLKVLKEREALWKEKELFIRMNKL
jgi:DNA-binding MurR/RpiR family transcriptional regulator